MGEKHKTFCRNCSGFCGLVVETEGGQITSIRGDMEHISAGYMCIKGTMTMDWHNGEDRQTHPRKRLADGTFQRADRDTCLDEIHEKLTRILEKHGPKAVGIFYGTGSKTNAIGVMTMRAWIRAIGSPNLFSSSTVDQSAKWVVTGRMGSFMPGRHLSLDADVTMLVGCNPLVSHNGIPVLPANNPRGALLNAKRRGMKLIVVDPRRTETARYADIHLQLKPGEDPALFAGLLHIILREGWQDAAFCSRFVTSLDRLRRAVAPFTPEVASARCGVPVELMFETAEMFATATRPTAVSGTGPDMSSHSNLSEHLIEDLSAVCGAYRRAGDKVRNPGVLFPRDRILERVLPPDRTWEREPKLPVSGAGLIMGEFPCAVLPREIMGGRDDRIRALIAFGSNPVTAISGGHSMADAMERLELSVTVGPRFSETARHSQYFMPTPLLYERHDITYQVDNFFSKPFVQVTKPFMKAPPDTIQDHEFFWELAHRSGLSLKITPGGSIGAMPGPGAALEISPLRKPKAEDIIAWLCERAGISYDEVLEHPSGLTLDRDTFVEEADDAGTRLDVCPPDLADELETYRLQSNSNEFPYRLTVRRMIETLNSSFRDASITRRRHPVNYAFMHPDDMQAEGLIQDSGIEILSEEGCVVAYVRADPGLRRGQLSISHQWGRLDQSQDPTGNDGAFTGRLVSIRDHCETINFMPRQSGVPVKLISLGRLRNANSV